MLKAIRILVQVAPDTTEAQLLKANQTKEGLPVALDKHILGFDTDAVLNEAAQFAIAALKSSERATDKINEAISSIVQAIIADPKTDHRLGKAGR